MHVLVQTLYQRADLMSFKKNIINFFLMLVFVEPMLLFGADDLLFSPLGSPSTMQQAEPVAPSTGSHTATDAESLHGTFNEFLSSIKSFDYSKAYYAFVSKEFQKNISLDTFKSFVKQYKVLFRNKQTAQKHVSFAANTAEVTEELVSIDGDVYEADITFILYDGEWKIQSISLTDKTPSHPRPLR